MLVKSNEDILNVDFLAGVTILVDKPLHWTSFDVVNKIRYALKNKLKVKKIKVGHAGTLDPLATGLLIIAIGKDTKRINDYQNLDKTYTGIMTLGATTKSYDAEFTPDKYYPTDHITNELLDLTRIKFIGEIEQVPPHFSAVKIKGKSAYKLARKGIDFKIKKRVVSIHKFDLNEFEDSKVKFEVECQKGTYIRSLVNDFGKELDSGAFLSGLRRTRIGEFMVLDAFILDDLINILNKS